jgi:hypothetical protein
MVKCTLQKMLILLLMLAAPRGALAAEPPPLRLENPFFAFVVLGAWCVVLGAWCLVRGAWCVVLGAWCLVRGSAMAEIYREILADPRLPHSEALKGYRTRLWSRMTRVKQALEREARRQSSSMDSEQQAAIEQAAQDLAEQMSLMNYTMGGPAYVFQQGGGAFGGRAVNDYGQELIQLIERTIRPDFWDTAGGPGRMFYYQPLMALVVTATSEVHGNVGGLLGDLRRAGQ